MHRLLWTSVLFACLLPSQAEGATVSNTSYSFLTYAAGPGEQNALTVSDDGRNLVFTDPAGVTPGAGCADDPASDPTVALCNHASIVSILAFLQDGNDEIRITNARDLLTYVYGGTGNDTLRSPESALMLTTYLYGMGGTDTYVPGPSFEWVTYSDRTDGVTASLDDQTNDPEDENVPSAIDALDGSQGGDTLSGSAEDDRLSGGDGRDTVRGGAGNDNVTGGSGNDRLEGGDDNDVFPDGEGGSDEIFGGAGIDRAVTRVSEYDGGGPRDAAVSLDDDADDGGAFEFDNVHSDVEDVTATTFNGALGRATLVGNAGANTLNGGVGEDTIDGGGGADHLNGLGSNDTISARDGVSDRVDCGPGSGDVANVDQHDEVFNCETVNRETAPGPPPPATQPAPPAEVRTVVVTRPPPPPPPVQRLAPTVRFRVTPARDRTAPYRFRAVGGVVLPRTISAAQGCGEGFVSVQVKRGARTISTRRVGLKADCGFSSTVTFARRLRGRLTMTVRFLGNAALLPRTARPVAVRAG